MGLKGVGAFTWLLCGRSFTHLMTIRGQCCMGQRPAIFADRASGRALFLQKAGFPLKWEHAIQRLQNFGAGTMECTLEGLGSSGQSDTLLQQSKDAFYFLFVGSTGVGTQSLESYHFSHASSSFCFSLFFLLRASWLFLGLSRTMILLLLPPV